MSIDFDIVCVDQSIGALEFRQDTVRAIGDILPLVIAKYGIDRIDNDGDVAGKSEQFPRGRIGSGSGHVVAATR